MVQKSSECRVYWEKNYVSKWYQEINIRNAQKSKNQIKGKLGSKKVECRGKINTKLITFWGF